MTLINLILTARISRSRFLFLDSVISLKFFRQLTIVNCWKVNIDELKRKGHKSRGRKKKNCTGLNQLALKFKFKQKGFIRSTNSNILTIPNQIVSTHKKFLLYRIGSKWKTTPNNQHILVSYMSSWRSG